MPPRHRAPRRRIALVLLALGLFVALDLGLFGWLIFRSLSRQEVERVLLATREEASELAERIARSAEDDGDLYTAIATERETRTYLNALLQRRDLVREVRVTDSDGVLVYRARTTVEIPEPGADGTGAADPGGPELPGDGGAGGHYEEQVVDREIVFPVDVPIADFGQIAIGVDGAELEARMGVLRQALLRQAISISLVTLAALGLAGLLLAWQFRRARQAEELARERERLADLGALAAQLAHEIRNPLNSLGLNVQLLEEELSTTAADPGDRGRPSLLSITRSEIARLDRLVGDLLIYARPPELRRERVAAVDLLQRTRTSLASLIAERRAEVRVLDLTGGAELEVDPEQFEQLLRNLLENALHAGEGLPRRARVEMRVVLDGGALRFEISDNGRGIPEEEQEQVFELFHSTRKGGTGLGLAIVDRIARAHEAAVELESEAGEGTRFYVTVHPGPGLRPDA